MPEPLPRVVRWSAWSGADDGLEHLELRSEGGRIVATGVVVGSTERGAFGLSYRLVLDDRWRVLKSDLATASGRFLALSADGAGTWRDERGGLLPELSGAVDIDIEATPFTNTLPIRRLGLAEGDSAAIRVAYVSLPELAVTSGEQHYIRLAAQRYRFESLDSDFTAELPVDAHGLVLDYPGLFRRLAESGASGR